MKRKINVGLVQINNSFDRQCYLPYTVGMLQAYAQRHLPQPENFHFMIPVFYRISVNEAVARLSEAQIVCFSTYVWNIRLSLAIAAALKAQNPDVVTVFGGPQIPDKDTETFLRENPCVDLACHGEGEQVFLAVLENYHTRTWQQVPSLCYLDDNNCFVQTVRCGRITDMTEIPSPFLTGVFDPLLSAHPEVEWVGLWETNRGCPFTCAYCDWGSQTKNRVVARDIEEVYCEADWFSDHRIEFIFCCDANFSLLARDLDIVRRIADNKKRWMYPKALSVQSTKNFTETSYAIYELMGEAGLSKGVSLSLQSVHPGTLTAIRRQNIPAEVFREAQHRLSGLGIETFTDIILPLPEETYGSFVDGVCATIENGQHNRIQFNNLSILPNALMGDPDYQRTYEFETVETDIVNIHGQFTSDNPLYEKQKLVIATAAMPQVDWVHTRVFSWMTALLHFDKLLQIPFVLLNRLYGLDYRALLETFVNGALPPVLSEIRQLFSSKALAIAAGDVEYCRSERWLNIWWPADELTLIRLCTENKLDAFYREAELILHRLLEKQGVTGFAHVLEEAVLLNKNLIKQPFQTTNLEIDLAYNLWDVYTSVLQGKPANLDKGRYTCHIDRQTQCWDSWEDWCRRVIWWSNKRGAYIYPCRMTQTEKELPSGIKDYVTRPQDRISSGGVGNGRNQYSATHSR
ncbi:B12-binding domain-containing radical SAM protein [Planctomycetota bacterium]